MRIYILTLLCILHLSAFAQEEEPLRVVARGGVNIRETPSTQGRKLVTAPFGATLSCLEDAYYECDEDPDTVWIDGIKGKWLRVRYDGVSGYAFDGYFGNMFETEEVQSPFRFFTGEGCNVPFLRLDLHPHQYGLFRTSDGRSELRAVKLNYVFVCSAYGYRWMEVRCPSKDTAVYYFVSPSPLKTGIGPCHEIVYPEERYSADGRTMEIKAPGFGLTLSALMDPSKDHILEIVVTKGGKRQVLFSRKDEPDSDWTSIWLDWVGDIDMDGVPDLIWTRGKYYSALSEVWLSSKGSSGKLWGKVAETHESGCC